MMMIMVAASTYRALTMLLGIVKFIPYTDDDMGLQIH